MEPLQNLIEPRLFEAINKPNPPHDIRIKAIKALKEAGLTKTQITEQLKTLGWEEWNTTYADKQIETILKGNA